MFSLFRSAFVTRRIGAVNRYSHESGTMRLVWCSEAVKGQPTPPYAQFVRLRELSCSKSTFRIDLPGDWLMNAITICGDLWIFIANAERWIRYFLPAFTDLSLVGLLCRWGPEDEKSTNDPYVKWYLCNLYGQHPSGGSLFSNLAENYSKFKFKVFRDHNNICDQ